MVYMGMETKQNGKDDLTTSIHLFKKDKLVDELIKKCFVFFDIGFKPPKTTFTDQIYFLFPQTSRSVQ